MECIICTEIITTNTISCNQCKIIYHDKCINEWLLCKNNCPHCRCIIKQSDKLVDSENEVISTINHTRNYARNGTYYYATNYNVLRIMSGMGASSFSN